MVCTVLMASLRNAGLDVRSLAVLLGLISLDLQLVEELVEDGLHRR